MSSVMSCMRVLASRSTRVVGMVAGERFPFYYVSEYPRSGGTWLSQMVADYLKIPFPIHYVFPLGFQCVVHNHWPYSSRFQRVVYLYRDGRDICISMLFFALRGLHLCTVRK